MKTSPVGQSTTGLTNTRWHCGAKQVLEIAQELYEKHKVISYPRSDSGYLPEDQFTEASKVIGGLRKSFGSNEYMYLFDGLDMARKSRAWNDAKVTAHHGIVPTMQLVQINSLGEPERNIYRVIAERYLMQFLTDHEYESVKLKLDAGGVNLEASGKQTMIGGWKALEQSEAERVDPPIPYLNEGETVAINHATVMDRQTKPPARYTEGTLIKGMTRIAAEVENPDIRAILREHDGIGTEATRAEIIQTLKNRGFIEVRKKSLYSTPKGRELIAAIPKELTDPSTTAVMERLLSEVEAGKTSLAQFMAQQQELVNNWISNAKEALRASGSPPSESSRIQSAPQSEQNLGNCPDCDSPLAKRRGKYGVFVGCSNYSDCRYIRKGKNGATQQKTQFSTEKICIQCGSPMVVRNGKRGPFLGCSSYPKCRQTAQMKG